MKTQDVIDEDFKQKPVMLIKDEDKLRIMGNPVHYPIFMSLRDGYKTVKEIEEDYTKLITKEAKKKGMSTDEEIEEYVEKNRRSDKSLYRYLQNLIDAGFVVLIGKRVALDKPMTEKLFARTAKFFFVDSYSEKTIYANDKIIESMTQLLGLVYDVPKLDQGSVEEFINLLIESSKKITSMLFKDKAEEFAQYAEDLSLDEVGSVLQMLGLIELVSDPENYSKLVKSIKK